MSLFEITDNFSELFEQFDAISEYEFPQNEKGDYVDDDGNVISDVAAAREEMLQAWFDTLTGIEEEWGLKAENVAVYIKSLAAEAAAMKAEESKLKVRRISKENSVERLKRYLMDCMDKINVKKFDMVRANISIRNNAESVEILNDIALINWAQKNNHEDLLKYTLPEIRKSDVKKLLQNGADIPDARLTRTQSLIIK